MYWLLGIIMLLYVFSFYFPLLFQLGNILSLSLLIFFLLEYALLFFTSKQMYVLRSMDEVLSNADQNKIELEIVNELGLHLNLEIIDELPVQFQERNFKLKKSIKPRAEVQLNYFVRPTSRGEYHFGKTIIYAATAIGLLQRRFSNLQEEMVKVYPSYLKFKKYSLRAIAMRDQNVGSRKVRKGSSSEFDQIKEYVRGDDVRTINWRASARRSQLMLNTYMDEKSQQVLCIIDKSRLMRMPFNGVSLLDYSINAALMFSFVAMQKQDKVGLITFSNTLDEVLKPARGKAQFNKIVENLYRQKTNYLESNFELLQYLVKKEIGQRSLIFLFTNFENYVGFERKLPYFKMLAKKHLLCLILFENTELKKLHEQKAKDIEEIYIKTIADKYLYEKRMMLKELKKNGILAIYSAPEELSVNVVNKYLDLKTKRHI